MSQENLLSEPISGRLHDFIISIIVMSRRSTLADVAHAAGVSTATVDRVLNSRLPVREATALKVIQAAERIGYHGAALMRERLHERSPVATLGFCLQKRDDPFYQAFSREVSAAARRLGGERCTAVVEFMDRLEPAEIARQLLELGALADAMAVVAVDHPHVTAAIDALHERGKPTYALLSDLSAPRRAGFIGVDPRKSGRTAAWAVSHLSRRDEGKAAVFVGSHRYLGQESCEMSFRSYLREHAPGWQVLDTLVNLEDPQLAYEAMQSLLDRHPDLTGLYIPGGGASGIIRALREMPVPPGTPRRVTVCNELLPDRRAALIDGVVDLVLDTPLTRISECAVRTMLADCDAREAPSQARQLVVSVDVYTPENV